MRRSVRNSLTATAFWSSARQLGSTAGQSLRIIKGEGVLAKAVHNLDGTANMAKIGGTDRVPESVSHANAHGFSLRAINPGRYADNCAECAVLTDDMLAGNGFRAARDIGLTELSQLERVFGSEFSHNLTAQEIKAMLSEAGPESRAIIYAHKGHPESGHYFNAINQGGTVRFLNGQMGTAQDLTGFVDGQMSILWTKP
jgi:hypothetical protein